MWIQSKEDYFFLGCNFYFEWEGPKSTSILLGRFYFTVKQLWILGMFGDISVLYLPISDWCVIARFIPHDCVLVVHYYPPSLYSSAHPTLGMCISRFYHTYIIIYIYIIYTWLYMYLHTIVHMYFMYVVCMCVYTYLYYTHTHICHIFLLVWKLHSSGFFTVVSAPTSEVECQRWAVDEGKAGRTTPSPFSWSRAFHCGKQDETQVKHGKTIVKHGKPWLEHVVKHVL